MQRRRRSGPTLQVTAPRGGAPGSLAALAADVEACTRCARLRRYCLEVARTKRRAYRAEAYWGLPVPAFGTAAARLWILGLAPAAHGANRTGRMFTGDSSGDWLFAALHATGFAKLPHSRGRDDGQELQDAYISAVVRCAPPLNKPARSEIEQCADYLVRELEGLSQLRVLLCLGQIAFAAALRLLEARGYEGMRPRPRFAHAAEFIVTRPGGAGAVTLLASYHPSRQNTQTRRLTKSMWEAVFQRARELLPRGV